MLIGGNPSPQPSIAERRGRALHRRSRSIDFVPVGAQLGVVVFMKRLVAGTASPSRRSRDSGSTLLIGCEGVL